MDREMAQTTEEYEYERTKARKTAARIAELERQVAELHGIVWKTLERVAMLEIESRERGERP